MGTSRLGVAHTSETIKKLSGIDNRGFPPKCIKCLSRDSKTCAKYNMSCFEARETSCFKRQMRRIEHEEYVKK